MRELEADGVVISSESGKSGLKSSQEGVPRGDDCSFPGHRHAAEQPNVTGELRAQQALGAHSRSAGRWLRPAFSPGWDQGLSGQG